MNGLTLLTSELFEDLSRLSCIRDYCMIGGTALALQLNHRLSEDLDFCRWKTYEKERITTSNIFWLMKLEK